MFHPSGTFVEFPKEDVEASIPARFEKIVQLYGNCLSLKARNIALTYDELNRAANRVARAILQNCGDNLSPVMVLTDHRPEAIIACLGALKAGKIMVAADPSFPIDRLKFMTDDSRAEAVLTYGDNIKIAAHLVNRNRSMINVDALGSDISIDNLSLKRAPDDPAIIRYTSGSSGRPKGVIRNHRRSLFSYMSLSNRTALCPEDRLIILRRLSFNTGDTFKSLMAGAAIFPSTLRSVGFRVWASFCAPRKLPISSLLHRFSVTLLKNLGNMRHFRIFV